uniref:Extended synaptotagmin 2 n=1 Tax=Hucho hucho TaxID=62062 RepID=A0A4W5LHW5_9TELE
MSYVCVAYSALSILKLCRVEMRRAAAANSGAQVADSGKTTSTGPTTAKKNGPTTPSPPVSPTTPIAPVDLGDEPQSSVTDATQMWMKFAKTFIVIFPIYVLGYFEFSFSWVLIGLAIFFWWRRNQGHKNNRLTRALAFLEHEEKTVKQNVSTSELPPWVHFPDVERVEWLNKTVKQMWPYICQFVDKLFRETIEPAVKGANAHLSSFCFTKIDMGDKPLRVNGVKVYTENVDKRQIIMDLEISFVGNTEIDVDIKKYYCRAGIKSIQLHGVLRVVMEPLLGDMPLIGALSVFFLKKPLLDINWTGLTNMLDIPGLNGLCDNLIQDIIYSYLVLPNRITIPLVGEAQLAQLRFPIPKGVLRIHFLEAQDLLGKDKFLGGLIKGKSDPYGVLHIGNQLFQSKVVKENIHPKWNEVYEAMVYEHSGPQNLEIELFDEDTDQDDFLGRLMIDPNPLGFFLTQCVPFQWFVMEEVNTGKLHLKLEWLSLLPSPEKLDQVKSSALYSLSECYFRSVCMLMVFSEYVLADIQSLTLSSFPNQTRYKTNEPVWEEAFTFLIHNPKCQELEVEVKDEKHECSLGTLNLPLVRLLEAEDMTLHQRFPLKNSGPSCTLKIKIALRVSNIETNVCVSVHSGSASHFPLGEVQLTVRHSSQRNKLIVVVHTCRNLIAFTDHLSDPYVRLYLLPDKRRSGRRKTHTHKKTLNPVYDQIFEFSVSIVELHRRTLDVAVKNGGNIFSKHKGLLGKVRLDLASYNSTVSIHAYLVHYWMT